jgi:hypothetical protein
MNEKFCPLFVPQETKDDFIELRLIDRRPTLKGVGQRDFLAQRLDASVRFLSGQSWNSFG